MSLPDTQPIPIVPGPQHPPDRGPAPAPPDDDPPPEAMPWTPDDDVADDFGHDPFDDGRAPDHTDDLFDDGGPADLDPFDFDTDPVARADATSGNGNGPVDVGGDGGGRGGPRPRPGPGPENVLDGRWSRDSTVTRMMCAAAHLHGEYSETTAAALLDPSFTAIAPSWGLDPVALAQHAKLACDRRRERDRGLRYLLGGMIGIPLGVVALVKPIGLSPFAVALSVLAVSAGGFAAAWMIIFAHYELIRISVLESMNTRLAPRDTAPALDLDTRRRLEALAEANVVVFGGYQPFVGCGATLDSWTVCTDLSPAPGAATVPFTADDLQRHLLDRIPPQTPGELWAQSRLFVAGNAAKAVSGLIPDPRDRDTWPASRLPEDVLDRYASEPSPHARTYACLARPAWGGEIVIALLVRAELAGSKLFVEGRAHALLPPKASFREYKFVPKHPRRAWTAVARATAPALLPLLFGCFRRKAALVRDTHAFKRDRERLRRDLIEEYPFNFGATSSLREDVADPSELKYYASVDEVRAFRVLKRQVLSAIEGYLGERGLDVDDFRRQAERCLDETTVHLHDLPGSADSFGPHATITTHDDVLTAQP